MIVELVSKYLTTHKRLVVPNLGTFIVKVPGESVLFSNLIKTDDGVLRSLLAQNGVSEMEAAGMVDRFVFEVQYRLQNNGACRLGGFGELRSGDNGTVTFVYEPATDGENLDGEPHAKTAVTTSVTETATSAEQPVAAEPHVAPPAAKAKHENAAAMEDKSAEKTAQFPVEESAPTQMKPRSVADRAAALYDEQPMSVSPQVRPADYVKGLRYGKGRKIPAGREYGASRSSRKGDRIMIFAIVAAVLAIAALAYGYWCDLRASRMDAEMYEIPQAGAEDAVRNPDLDYIEPYDK